MSKWISVKERLPEVDTQVLIYYSDTMTTGFQASEAPMSNEAIPYWINSEIGCDLPVTHWMPLPNPPEGE